MTRKYTVKTHLAQPLVGPTLALTQCNRLVRKEAIVESDPECSLCQAWLRKNGPLDPETGDERDTSIDRRI